jgi:hypothetical protein
MKHGQYLVKTLLLLCLIYGSNSALLVSYDTYSGEAPCPQIFTVHICYLVLWAYLTMLMTLLIPLSKIRDKLFFVAWIIVFGFAIIGVFAEILVGDICPKNSLGIPLCYISLLLTMCIIGLFQLSKKMKR